MSNYLPPRKRPFTVTIVLWGVFLLGVWNVGRVIALYRQQDLLTSLAIQPPPQLQMAVSAVWAGLFLGMGWALRQKRPFVRRLIPLTLSLYAIWRIGLLIYFTRPEYTVHLRPLYYLGYLIAILFTTWVLNRQEISTRHQQKQIEQQQKTGDPASPISEKKSL